MTYPTDIELGDIYAAYAAGTLDSGFKLMLEAQAQIRADIAARMDAASNISGVFLENETPTAMSEGALDQTLNMIDAIEAEETAPQADAAINAGNTLEEMLTLPENLHDAMFAAVENDGWSRLMNGIERLPLTVDSEAEVELYRLTPGAKVPKHRHEGVELTLVLKGKFSDETGAF